MARQLICTAIEIRLISLLDLGQFELDPQPTTIVEAEHLCRLMNAAPKLLNLARYVERAAETGMLPYYGRRLAELAEEACRGL